LRGRMRYLAEQPLHGVQRDDIKSGYYSFFEGSHTIFYYVEGPRSIAVIDVLHQPMDPRCHLTPAANG
jgi:toxin ParE1/3/4